MRLLTALALAAVSLAPVSSAAQPPKLSASDLKELSGRWIGTVAADIGVMPIALDLKPQDGRLTGVLETGHGNWDIRDVRKVNGDRTIAIKAADGLEER